MRRLTLLLILVSLITINPRINGWNEASRMALTQSIVENGSFKIDRSVFVEGGDKVFIDGHFYSDKPPLPSLLAAMVYAPLNLLGFKLDFGWNLSYYLIILLTVKFFWIASVLAFHRAISFTSVNQNEIPQLVAIYAFASLSFTWSATFNNHSLAGSALMIALMFFLKSKESPNLMTLIWSGFFFGLAASMDIPVTIFLVGFSGLVIKRFGWSQMILVFAGAACVPLGIHALINYAIGGTLLPLQIVPEFFQFEGSTWTNNPELSGVSINSFIFTIKYGFLSLLGLKGFIWYHPILILLIPTAVNYLLKENPLKLELMVTLTGTLIIMLYYFLFSSNYGGWSYSIRWFVSFIPLLGFFVFMLAPSQGFKVNQRLVWGVSTLAILIALIGQINPWSNPTQHAIPLMANLKQLIGILF